MEDTTETETVELEVTTLDVLRDLVNRVRLVPHLLRGHVIEQRTVDEVQVGADVWTVSVALACATCRPIDWIEYP